MNMSRRIWILSVALAVSFSVCAQSKLSPYLRVSLERQLADSLVQTYSSRKTAARPQYVRAFITLRGACDTGSLEQLGVNIRTEAGRMLTADIPVDCLGKVAALEMVEYVEMGAPVKGRMDKAKEQAFVGKVHQGTGLPQAFDGKNVVMGFVDDGFDYAHPNFRTADKSELRIRKVWDQNAAGTPPEGYDYGNELDTEEEMLAVRHDVAESVHGTHVMGIASGAYDTGEPDFAGNAPGAEMVLVSVSTDGMDEADNTTVMDGIHYIFDYAESVGKPCVVNLSLGSHLGPRDGTSSFDQMADELQGPGRLIVGAVGNDGGTACHVSKSFFGAAKDTLQTLYDYQYSYPRHITMEIWGDEGMSLSFIPIVVDKATGDAVAYFESVEVSPEKSEDYSYDFGQDDPVSGSIVVAAEMNPLNGKPHLYVESTLFDDSDCYTGFCIVSESAGTVHVWADNVYGRFSNYGLEQYLDGNDENTMGEIGGSGKRIISAGAYVSKDYYENFGIFYPSDETLHDVASFSSHGPTPDGRVKPDISAPGSYVVSSLSGKDTGTPREQYVTWNDERYYYGYMQGTSMASPFVAGIMALWLQARPELSPEEAKDVLHATALNDAFTGDVREAGDEAWGYGKIDAWEGLKECLKLNEGSSLSFLREEDRTVVLRPEKGRLSVLFAKDLTDVSLSVYAVGGMLCAQASCRKVAAGDEVCLDMDGSKGMYVLKLVSSTGENISKKFIIR